VYPGGRLLLAPFGADELKVVLPIPMSILEFELKRGVPLYTSTDAARFLQAMQGSKGNLTWGIFDTMRYGFLGSVSVYEVDSPLRMHEISAMIYKEPFLNRGFGTVACLAICKYMFKQGALALHARTSTDNTRAQKVLARMGFVDLGPCQRMELVCGDSQMDLWALAGEFGQVIYGGSPNSSLLYDAWQNTFNPAVEQFVIEELSS
jgi:RimJ/RimL family protein N-acetyltransferase